LLQDGEVKVRHRLAFGVEADVPAVAEAELSAAGDERREAAAGVAADLGAAEEDDGVIDGCENGLQ
jgi:hypothetical protein